MSRLRRKAYVDLDPGFTQFWHADGIGGARLDGHDCYFTVGENIGTPGLRRSPPAGIDWRPVRAAVVLEEWPVAGAGDAGSRSRRSARGAGAFGPVEFDGHTYGLKVHEFRKVIELPAPFAAAVRDRARHPPRRRRATARRSRPTAGRSSTRAPTVRGPARVPRLRAGLGRGVLGRAGHLRGDEQRLVQRPHRALPRLGPARRWCRTPASARTYPVGEGLVAFTLEEAVDGAERIAADYEAPPPRRARARRGALRLGQGAAPLPRRSGTRAMSRQGRRAPAGRGPTRHGARADVGLSARDHGRASWPSRSCRPTARGDEETDPPSELPPLALAGDEETVFDWIRRTRAPPIDIPDPPARAFRDAAARSS